MKSKLWQFIVALTLLLSACGQTPIAYTPVTGSTFLPTVSPSETIQPSTTFTPTITQFPATRTITPLPTIPTFTPTFDARTIVTVTPASLAACAKEDSSVNLAIKFDDQAIDVNQEILDYLNSGGSVRKLASELSGIYGADRYRLADVTNDGNPDLIFSGFRKAYDTFYILWCQNGQFSLFSGEKEMGVAFVNTIFDISDLNNNGLPEIVIYKRSGSGAGEYHFFIGEWNGETFVNLAPDLYVDGVDEGRIEIQDTNHDGIKELILVGGYFDHIVPWRQSIYTFIWNGKMFIRQPIEYDEPKYRFQAIQDGDYATENGNYEKAIVLYQDVISNKNLEWWSIERQKYEQAVIDAQLTGQEEPFAQPLEDKTEYSRLAAYAYYRIILLQYVRGYESDAGTVYNTLQQKFGADPYGRPYAEMATAFWGAYQSAHSVYDGCAAAIHYADEHLEILIPLGSDYHGAQSHTYVPVDVCPFR